MWMAQTGRICVHRKGATRAYGPNRDELPPRYRDVGQPVIIPGDMGTYSFILAGTDKAMKESFGSTCHGAGRMMSRSQAKRTINGSELKMRAEDAEGNNSNSRKHVRACRRSTPGL